MRIGVLHGIGVGPGDPELITVKAANILGAAKYVFAPRSRQERESKALAIAKSFLNESAIVKELVFPMTKDEDLLQESWRQNAHSISEPLVNGEDACFLTLGDSTLYSTFTYVARTLRTILPEAQISIIPGITAFSAVAALTGFPLAVAKNPVTILPSSENLELLESALKAKGSVVIMKVGKRLDKILDLLDELNLMERSVYAAKVGLEGQRLVKNLRELKGDPRACEYISTILVNCP